MTSKARGPSAAGNHYVNLYQCCPRKFYLRFILGWEPRFLSPALLNGLAFHGAKALYYETRSKARALSALALHFASEAKRYEKAEDLSLARTRLPTMISTWIARFGEKDLSRYKILEVEHEHEIALLGGFVFTVRLDALVRDRDGNYLILETKTSSWRPELTEVEVANGEQSTAYIAAVCAIKNVPPSRVFLLPDIISWPRASVNVAQLSCYRGELVQRDEAALDQWKLGVSNIMAEISQKAAALHSCSPYALFPRNTQWCTSFAHPCEYIHVCRREVEVGVPSGFSRDRSLPSLVPATKRRKK